MEDYEIREEEEEESKKSFNFHYDSYMLPAKSIQELKKEGY